MSDAITNVEIPKSEICKLNEKVLDNELSDRKEFNFNLNDYLTGGTYFGDGLRYREAKTLLKKEENGNGIVKI